ncbi:hypothetical protein [Streptomyces sp. NPDC001492]
MRTFLPDDQPHALRPAVQEVAGEFGAPRAVPQSAFGFDRLQGRGLSGASDCVLDGIEGLPGDIDYVELDF